MNYILPLLLESGFAFQDYGMFASTAHGTAQELVEKVIYLSKKKLYTF